MPETPPNVQRDGTRIIGSPGGVFKIRPRELSFEPADIAGRGPPRRWPRGRVVRLRAVTDVDPPGSVRPRSRLVLELRDPTEEVTIVARGKTHVMATVAHSMMLALGLIPRNDAPQNGGSVWVSPGTLRREAARRWLAAAPTLPGDARDPAAEGPPVLDYMPDPKDQMVEERWPGGLRLIVPGLQPDRILRDPVILTLGLILAVGALTLVSPALRASYFPVPLPPLHMLIVPAIVFAAGTLVRLRSSVIEVDVSQVTLTYRLPLLRLGGQRKWSADTIESVRVREGRELVIYQRPEKSKPIFLARFPTAEEAETAARRLQRALGLSEPGKLVISA